MLAIKDLYTHTSMLAPVAKTTTWTSSALDLKNSRGNTILFVPGLWTDGTHTPKLQDSADGTTYADVAAANMVGSFSAITSTATAVVQKVSYIGANRYVQVVCTLATATTGMVSSVLGITKPRKLPAP